MRECARCGGAVDGSFRFCPWCAAPQRIKLVEFFRPHARLASEHGKALRVSRYFGPTERHRHVRFSVWNEHGEGAEATAAVSLGEEESERLARFLLATRGTSPRRSLRGLVDQIRAGYLSQVR